MIKSPPRQDTSATSAFLGVLTEIQQTCPDKLADYLDFRRPVDAQGRYLHFDEFRYRVGAGLKAEWAWALLRSSREQQFTPLLALGEPPVLCQFMVTPTIQNALSMTDLHTTAAALEWIGNKIGEANQIRYLLNDLTEDEAISSSQLEGAATTTLVAKDMLKRKRKPRTPDEKMILGNFKMMQFAWGQRHQPLSLALVTDMHRMGVAGIDDDKYTPGAFRRSDDVAVVDADGDIAHYPPPAAGLEQRLQQVVAWANTKHDVAAASQYLHPLIKAIALHFIIGYEHPFRDGNGRVARGLFYWFMFKHDYAAFRYIAISTLLKKAPVQYGKAYLYTETDGLDLTYFLDHQCAVILRAIDEFLNTYRKTLGAVEAFDRWVWDTGLYQHLSDKQRTLFNVAKHDTGKLFTAVTVQENLNCSYNTAATALNGLVALNLFGKRKEGREWVYYLLDREAIQQVFKK